MNIKGIISALKTNKGLFFILFSFFTLECSKDNEVQNIDFKQEMRNFIVEISEYSKVRNNGFLIIPQNGQEILTINGEYDGNIEQTYLKAIDAIGREDLFYGYSKDNKLTPSDELNYLIEWCTTYKQNNIPVLVTDYCSSHNKIDDSYSSNNSLHYNSFAAPERELNIIPKYPISPFNENTNPINSVDEIKNFLYIINSEKYNSKLDFISALSNTNYDLIIIDLFHNEDKFSIDEINQLKKKKNGNNRLVICYMSIGEAEDYRFYWKDEWKKENPIWLKKENPNWRGNYKVKYWNTDWKAIIYGSSNTYLDQIINAGFDGVYLDIIDAFEYFE